MRDVKIDIASTGFPSQFVSDAEKATYEFGLQIGQEFSMSGSRKMATNVDTTISGVISID